MRRAWCALVGTVCVAMTALLAGCAGGVAGTAQRASGAPVTSSPPPSPGNARSVTSSPPPSPRDPGSVTGSSGPAGQRGAAASKDATVIPVGTSHALSGVMTAVGMDDWKLSVTLVRIVMPVHASDGSSDPGFHLVGLDLTIANTGDIIWSVLGPAGSIVVNDPAGHEFDCIVGPSDIDAGSLLPFNARVAPDQSVSGFAVVEIPDSSHISRVSFAPADATASAVWTIPAA